jgi:tetratricopeptide (TPR) repeat protein
MSFRLRLLQVFILCFFLGTVHGLQDSKQAQVKKWIDELGDADFTTRENAHKNLWKAGSDAEEQLKVALKGDDAEIRKRSLELLEKFKWGIYHDSPIAIIDLIQAYQSGTLQDKEKSIAKLIEMGGLGVKSVIKIINAEEQEEVRNSVLSYASKSVSKVIPYLIEKNEFKFLEQILQMMLENRAEGVFSNYAVYAILSSSTDKIINELSKNKPPKISDEINKEILAYLYRSKGEHNDALKFAKESKNPELYTQLALEASKWKVVLDTDHFPDDLLLGKLGYKLAMYRLINEKTEFDGAKKTLVEIAEELTGKDKNGVESTEQLFQAAKIALLNYMVPEGIDCLLKNKKRMMVAEIYASRFEFDKIKSLIEEAKNENAKDVPSLEIHWAKILYGLGEKEQALKILDQYSSRIADKSEGDWPLKLVNAWILIKKKDRALDDAASYLQKIEHREASGRMLNKIFGDDSEFYDPLFRFFFKKKSTETAQGVIKQINDLHDKKLESKVVVKLVDDLLEYASTVTAEESVSLKNAAGAILKKYSLDEKLKELADKFGSETILLSLADLYAEKKEWVKARDAFKVAWDKDKSKSIIAFMISKMEENIGDKTQASKWKDLATWSPLGNEQVRLDFAYALGKRNYMDDALIQFDLVSKTGEPGSYSVGASSRALASRLIEKKSFEKAADGYELAMLRCMTPFVSFTQSQAYVNVPSLIARLRCRSAIENGDFDKVDSFAAKAFDLQPGEVELPILVYQPLIAKGKKELADKIFASAKKTIQKVGDDYPNCAWAHNSAAWLSACCKSDLIWGLNQAEMAVKLDGKSAAHLDTLAEVLFQLKRQKEAVEAQTKAVALEPTKIYYKKQLKRIQNGDPSADRPEENDD